jgi:putative nucleotidyltransferase with HDIG domain
MMQMNMLENIMTHSLQVCRVAAWISGQLCSRGADVNRELVQAGALLHDITKTRSIDTGEIHSQTGSDYMNQLGYPEVGEIVRQHVQLDVYFESTTPSEAEIVNYSDKRVLHDRIVTLEERMDYILERYGNSSAARNGYSWLRDISVELEQRIFKLLPIKPRSLATALDAVDLTGQLNCILTSLDQPAG